MPKSNPNPDAPGSEEPSSSTQAKALSLPTWWPQFNDHLNKYSDDEQDPEDTSRKELEAFVDEMQKDAVHCSCLFLVVWIARYLLITMRCWNPETRRLDPPAFGSDLLPLGLTKRDWQRIRLRRLMVWLLFIVAGQVTVYVGLGWAVVNEASHVTARTNNSLCPGQDDNRNRPDFSWAYPDLYHSSLPQEVTFAGLLLYMTAHTAFDWMRTHKMYFKFVKAVAPAPWVLAYGLRPSKRRAFVCFQQHFWPVIVIDFYLHVFMTLVVFYIKTFALFYVASVGGMISLGFGLEFLAKQDDIARSEALTLTPLAKWMHDFEAVDTQCPNPRAPRFVNYNSEIIKSRWGGLLLTVGELVYHLLYLCVFALIVWAAVWLFWGCKPGRQNALMFF